MSDNWKQDRDEAFWNSADGRELSRVLFEEAVDGIFITDAQGLLVAVNPRGSELSSYSPEQLLGMTFTNLLMPEDCSRDSVALDELRQGGSGKNECFLRRKDGSLLSVEIRVSMLPTGNFLHIVRDITARKQAENISDQCTRELVASQARLNAILEKTSDLVSTSTLDARLTYLNQAGREMAGWGREESLDGRMIADLHPAWAVEKIEMEGIPAAVANGLWEGETAILRRDGVEIPVSQVILAHRSSDGTIQYFSTIMRNITERKRAEMELRESEEKYRQLLDTTGTGYVIVDELGRVFDANLEYAHLTGRQLLEEVIGHSVLEWTAPHDIERNSVEVRKCVEKGFVRNLEIDYVTPSGKFIPVDINATVLRSSASLQILTLCRDITERRMAEEALRALSAHHEALLSAIPDIIIEVDGNKVYTWANQAGLDFFGDEVIGKEASYYFEGDQETYLDLEPLFRGDEGVVYIESWQRRKDGEKRLLAWWCRVLKDASGNVTGAISSARDITERKLAEEEKEKLQAQLLQAQKMESVGRLAGGVAHDFNNMLSAILGHAELALMKCKANDPVHGDLKVIEESAHRSADLTRQLLAFARKQTVAPKVLDVNDTVAGLLKMLMRLIGEDIELVWMPGAGLWPVKIDPSQIDQMLANLCVNARDAIAGVGKIIIETENTTFDKAYCAVNPYAVEGEYVILSVSDNGCGMDKEVLDRLFEPFFTTKELGKGTGLGLATVYGIVKQNEGFVNVYSEPGKGTTVKIYLPRFMGETVEVTTERPDEAPRGKGELVLLVEDEAMILRVGQAMLEGLGYRVLAAGTPSEALHQTKAHAAEIQLLITDVVMPEMNGKALAKVISDIKPGLKCLFTSGYTTDIIAHRGVLDEGVNFLAKPFSLQSLASKVRQVLAQD